MLGRTTANVMSPDGSMPRMSSKSPGQYGGCSALNELEESEHNMRSERSWDHGGVRGAVSIWVFR